MRFFTNDKDPRDDQQGVDVQERTQQANEDQAHPERVTSEPVAVPQQRPSSPWSSTPDIADTSDAELAEQERADGTHEGRPPFHEPAPQPTAFGASTVGGAVAASAMAGPENDRWSATDRDSAADSGVGDDRTVAPGDGVVTGDRTDPVDVALDDQGGFDDPHVRDTSTSTREDTTPPDASDTRVAADGTFRSPQAVDPGTGRPLDEAPAPGPAPAAAPATATSAPAGSSLFDAGDATAFRERWRDVQLRFVDSPKDATTEAAGLLDEAVDRLAAGLRDQKARLAGTGTDDTERLRLELRGYRDMLNRILDL